MHGLVSKSARAGLGRARGASLATRASASCDAASRIVIPHTRYIVYIYIYMYDIVNGWNVSYVCMYVCMYIYIYIYMIYDMDCRAIPRIA